MAEDRLSKLLKEADQQCFDNYKSKTIGELTNTKNATYIQKLKAEFKSKKQIVKKKNADQIKKVSNQLFENLMQVSISQKLQQNMYPNISDIFADFNYVE
jgi:type III secretion system FlhB-like substrate exporter